MFLFECANLKLLKKNTKLPIIVKGVQSVEDVQLCADHGVQGVILVSESPMVQNEPWSTNKKTNKSCVSSSSQIMEVVKLTTLLPQLIFCTKFDH